MNLLDFFKRKEEPKKKKMPATLDEVPYPGAAAAASLSLRNNKVTREMLDLLPQLLEIDGLGKILRNYDYRNKNREYVHSILGGFAKTLLIDVDEAQLDEPVKKVLEITKGRSLFGADGQGLSGDYFDRTGMQHSIFILDELMWLPPERRLPMLNRIKADLSKVEDNGRSELYMTQTKKLQGGIIGEELLDYWKKEGYTVEEAMNYNPDKPVRHNMNGLMKQLGGVGNKVAANPNKGLGKKLYNPPQNRGDSGLQI